MALAAVFVAQGAWAIATTSGTFDETTYLGFGRDFYHALDASGFANWGVAPLPTLVTFAAPALAGWPSYPRAMTLARSVGLLLFGVSLVVLTYATLRRAFGTGAAIWGAALVSLSPNLVAHASVATTDMCFVVMALAACEALIRDCEQPSPGARAGLAVALSLALAAKYSALALFPVVALALFRQRPGESTSLPKRAGRAVAVTLLLFGIALVFVWALHLFQLVPFGLPPIADMRLPAPVVGIARQMHHQTVGEPAFLLGRRQNGGWWYYVPVALAVKSTPAELVLWAGALLALARGWRAATPRAFVWRMAFAIFAIAGLLDHVAFGVRHVLLLLPLAVFLAADWWRAQGVGVRPTRLAAGALVGLQAISAVSIAPHDLSYFNVFAGGPARGWRRLADSNVDWGQDLPALATELARVGARAPVLSYFGRASPADYGVRAEVWGGQVQAPFDRWDWVAISVTNLDGVFVLDDRFAAFRTIPPDARAGYSIFLFSTRRPEVQQAMADAATR